jgi:hypothetical protein
MGIDYTGFNVKECDKKMCLDAVFDQLNSCPFSYRCRSQEEYLTPVEGCKAPTLTSFCCSYLS